MLASTKSITIVGFVAIEPVGSGEILNGFPDFAFLPFETIKIHTGEFIFSETGTLS